MAVRQFDGVDDRIVFAPGAVASVRGNPTTWAAIWKPANLHAGGLFVANDGTSNDFAVNNFSNGQIWFSAASSFGVVPWGGSDGWMLAAITNTSGANGLRSHKLLYSGGSWSHTNVTTGLAASGATDATSLKVGELGSDHLNGLVAVQAVWDTILSDADLETLAAELLNWYKLKPVGLWAFDQPSTSDLVLDLTGGGANQTSIVGTAVVKNDDPPGFLFTRPPPPIATKLAQGAVEKSGVFGYNATDNVFEVLRATKYADLAVEALSGVNATATVTLPKAGVGLRHYVTKIVLAKIGSGAGAAVADTKFTSTNLPGNPTFGINGLAAAAGSFDQVVLDFPTPLRSLLANTATTIVSPAAAANTQWRATVFYYTDA